MGLYETAIDTLCTWEVNGRRVRPKVIVLGERVKSTLIRVYVAFLAAAQTLYEK